MRRAVLPSGFGTIVEKVRYLRPYDPFVAMILPPIEAGLPIVLQHVDVAGIFP